MDIGLQKMEADAMDRLNKMMAEGEARLQATAQALEDKLLTWAATHKIVISIEEKK